MFAVQKVAIFVALVAVLVESIPVGPPGSPPDFIPIVKQLNEINLDGSFKNSFETANGIAVDETGYVKNPGKDQISVVQGSNAYTAPDGTPIQLQYLADENGFQAFGNHLPTPPPPPPEILRALEYIASLPSTPEPKQ